MRTRAHAIAGMIAVVIAVSFGLLCGPPAVSAQAPPETARTVVLVIAPYFAWSDLTATSTPTLWKLASEGSIGAVNARSRDRERGNKGSPAEGPLTISSGAWTVHEPDAPAAFSVSERYETGTAADAFRRTTGAQVGENAVVFLGLPMTARTNSERSYDVVLGTLGETIKDAGGTVAAIGNSDVGNVSGEERRMRPAALAAMDERGLVPLGDVSARLLERATYAPFGRRTSLARFEATLGHVASAIAEKPDAPSLVVLDPGDLNRAMEFRELATDDIAEQQHTDAIGTLDRVTALARSEFPDAVLIVASQSTGSAKQGDPEGVGPIIVSGAGMNGYLTSDATQRVGLVTNPDITSSILRFLGLRPPVQVLGSALRSSDSDDTTEERVSTLRDLDATAVSMDAAKAGVVNTFVVFTVITLALCTFVLVRSSKWRPRTTAAWVTTLKAALLLALSVPVSAWLMFMLVPRPETPTTAISVLIVTTMAVWMVGLALWRFAGSRVPVAVLSLLTVVTILFDQWLGAPASVTNFFGYSPLLAARFYGLGNEGAAIVFGASIAGIALILDEWPGSRFATSVRLFGIPLVAGAVVLTAAAPTLGANVGVAIWGLVGFGLAWALMNGRAITWRLVIIMFAAVALLIVGLVVVDLFSGEVTHLGRSLQSAQEGGFGQFWQIIERKAQTNARVLTRTNWAYILVATLGFLGFMRWRPQGDFADALTENPAFAHAITVSLVAGLVAYFTEDSGIVIPALEVFYIGIGLSWLLLMRVRPSVTTDRRAEMEA